MDFEYSDKWNEQVRHANEEALQLFKEDLVSSGLAAKTISRHLMNADLFINRFLLDYEGLTFEEGIAAIDSFMGSFFIRKCMWSTPASIKSTSISIRKFYKCMLDHEKIVKDDYSFLCSIIKESIEEWQYTCELYNDPDKSNPFDFF